MTAAPLVDLRIATHRIRRVAANPALPLDLRHRLEETARGLDLEVDRARPEGLVRRGEGE